MSYNLKKVLAGVLAIIIVFGWYVTVFGIGDINSIKDEMKLGLDIKGGVYVVMEAETNAKGEELSTLMEQTQAVIENRVNQMGLSEPVVTIEGNNRIRVELPGVDDANDAINAIGRTAQLQFALADGTVVLDGSDIKTASTSTDSEHGGYAVTIDFTGPGSDKFAEATRLAYTGQVTSTTENVLGSCIMIILDNEIISAPQVNSVITQGTCQITSSQVGGYPQDEATELAALIRGGALPVALKEINSGTQTAKIGETALEQSVVAGLIGLVAIFIIMIAAYNIMGIAADIALSLYVIIVLWIMVLLGSVLTLPGIAGIILSIGMAVDANVIIFSRIREEIISGKSIRVAVQSGFKRAMSTVLDSQITTIIAALVLYQIGTSSVRGFALTLMIGIVVSILTAVVVTHLYLSLLADNKKFSKEKYFGIKADGTSRVGFKKQYDFLKYKKQVYIASISVVIVGLLVAGIFGLNYGIDFTGGTMMQVDFGEKVEMSQVEDVLKANGVDNAEIIYASENNSEVIIRTTDALDTNAREKVITSMENKIGDVKVISSELFGPSVGKELKNNAIKAVLIASLGMLIYIIIRFEWKFGVAAIAGVVHDIFMVIAFYAIFRVTINNPFIAGILTVVGYSINDTIVVFDRIRENLGFMKKSHTKDLINTSINQTIGRSMMTSFTTLIVMIPLYIMTGSAIREFVLPLMIGVIVGALSSITICSPLYHDLTARSEGSKYQGAAKKTSKKNK